MKDLIILGNGMAGMTAALYAKRANLDFKIVGKDEYDFGQIGEAILVENYPCAGTVSGFDLAMRLYDQLGDNGIKIEEHTVKEVRKEKNIFFITYENGFIDETKSVIYALGASHRKLNCEIEEGIPIHYCALCDGALYKDKTVAIIGGGDVAFTEAEYLSKICERVEIIMCDKNVTAAPSTFQRIKNIKNIEIIYDFPIDEITNNHYWTKIYSLRSDNRYLNVDGIFVAIGMEPNFVDINIPYFEHGPSGILTSENCETSIPGFFAAGDVRVKAIRQSITAAADGAIAVNSVINYLREVE